MSNDSVETLAQLFEEVESSKELQAAFDTDSGCVHELVVHLGNGYKKLLRFNSFAVTEKTDTRTILKLCEEKGRTLLIQQCQGLKVGIILKNPEDLSAIKTVCLVHVLNYLQNDCHRHPLVLLCKEQCVESYYLRQKRLRSEKRSSTSDISKRKSE